MHEKLEKYKLELQQQMQQAQAQIYAIQGALQAIDYVIELNNEDDKDDNTKEASADEANTG